MKTLGVIRATTRSFVDAERVAAPSSGDPLATRDLD
jgi:hypothetical protein